MINFRMLKYSDTTIWICTGALVLISFLLIYSATFSLQAKSGGDPLLYIKRHLFSVMLSILFMAGVSYLDYDWLKKVSPFIYLFVIILLIATYFIGFVVQGAQRWLALGSVTLQPSELAKLGIVISLAAYFEKRKGEIKSFLSLLLPFLLFSIPFFLIFRQPDLGTSLVVLFIFIGMLIWTDFSPLLAFLFLSPVLSIALQQLTYIWLGYFFVLIAIMYMNRIKIFDFLFVLFANIGIGYFIPHLWNALKGYQKLRLLAFLDPSLDPKGVGYHTLQSKIAIGSGGFWGRGLFHGTQTQLQFIPQQATDFIFSVAGEEFGFIGGVIILSLFVLIIWRGIEIAVSARDPFGALLAGGITMMFLCHFVVNIGMSLGLLPVVGIPLPLLSFGGTSLLINLMAIGILQSISMRRQKLLF